METLKFLMVASFFPPYHLGGDAIQVRYLSEALAAQGHEVHVEYSPAALALKGARPATDDTVSPDVERHPIPAASGRWQPLSAWILGAPPGVRRHHRALVRQLKPDVIHVHNLSLLGLDLLLDKGSALNVYTAHDYWVRCPRNDLLKFGTHPCEKETCIACCLVSAKPPQLWRYRDWVPRAWGNLDATIAPSAFLKRMIEGRLTCPVFHLPNFAPDRNPSGKIADPGDFYLYLGRLEAQKGIRDLAQAMTAYRGPHRLVVIGKGKERKHLEAARAKGAPIELRGWTPRNELDVAAAEARALIMPSIWYENSPLAAIEALCWGTPFLASNLGALPELTYRETCGLAFPPTPEGIVDVLERFERADAARRQRRPARAAYEASHTTQTYLDRYQLVLEAAWDARGKTRASTEPVTGLSEAPRASGDTGIA